MPSALGLGHVYAPGAQSLKDNLNILGFESADGGQKFIELVECDETCAIADLDGRTNDCL